MMTMTQAGPVTATALSVHVLDMMFGRPAAGVSIRLEFRDHGTWRFLGAFATDGDGRIASFGTGLAPGDYRLVFGSGRYFEASGRTCLYPEIAVHVRLDSQPHYHVPLLLGPYGYHTYLGS